MTAPRRLLLLHDAQGENWPSMELAALQLSSALKEKHGGDWAVEDMRPTLPLVARRVGSQPVALNADRAVGRYLQYPTKLFSQRRRFDAYHVADHSYSHLIHALPPDKTGVFCHDLDAFRCVLEPSTERRSWPHRALATALLKGLRKAAVVFTSTRWLKDEISSRGLVEESRLVCAPYGVAPEFLGARSDAADEELDDILSSLSRRPYLLHVGSGIPRKRLDVLFNVFSRVKARHPRVCLVQQGAVLNDVQRAQLQRLNLLDDVFQPPPLDREVLAGLYRRAAVVLLTSSAEGFGLPIIEGLASGAPVIASDLPALREVGGEAAEYCPVGDVEAWANAVCHLLENPSSAPSLFERRRHASEFSWAKQADVISDAYLRLTPQKGHSTC
jgi:glycosyltransferase involved in cell wall biosynthesis